MTLRNPKQELGLSDEQFGKLRLFNRILISYNDFKQAFEIASLLLDGDLYRHYPKKNRLLVIALNMAAIVSYSRPFLSSRGKLAHNRLPGKVLRILTPEEIEVHKVIIKDRNTMMAHSDADANISIPLVIDTPLGPIVYPKNASPYANFLKPEAMKLLGSMAFRLQEQCFTIRQEMEREVIDFLPRAHIELDNDAE